jgi:hypothetical protein
MSCTHVSLAAAVLWQKLNFHFFKLVVSLCFQNHIHISSIFAIGNKIKHEGLNNTGKKNSTKYI